MKKSSEEAVSVVTCSFLTLSSSLLFESRCSFSKSFATQLLRLLCAFFQSGAVEEFIEAERNRSEAVPEKDE